MRLHQKLFKNNRGLSLVEVVCAVAILGIVITAIGAAMVVSAKNYQKGTAEIEVQQEAQMTTNMIGDLLVDAVDVTWDETTKTLTIKKEGVTYTVVLDANGTLTYTEAVTGGSPMSGVLAENVTAFEVDPTKFASNKNVKIDLTVTKNGKEYEASHNTTARNGEVSGGVGAVEYANIVVTDKVIIEPGQTFELPVKMMGMTAEQVGGLNWSISSGSSADFVSKNNDCAVIKAGDDATGTFVVTVETGHKKKDDAGVETSDPLDRKQVVFNIRRVTGINMTSNCSGTAYTTGAVYTIKANVDGTNLDRGIGKGFDMDVYEYKNPRYIDFEISMEGMESGKSQSDYIGDVVSKEDETSPSVQFKLKADMPAGSKITITARAKHPEGQWEGTYYNKASVLTNSDDPYTPSVVETYVIESPTKNMLNIKDGYIMRGKHFVDFSENMEITNPAVATADARDDIIDVASDGTGFLADDQWYFRYKETGAPDDTWSEFLQLSDSGMFPTMTAELTEIFHPAKSYDLEFILAFVDVDDKKLMWPTDEALLDPDKDYGFEENGFTAGWLDASTADGYRYNYDGVCIYYPDSIGFDKYGGTYRLDAATLQFYDDGKPGDAGYAGYDGYGGHVDFITPANTFVNQVGSFEHPFEVTTNNRGVLWFETQDLFRPSYKFDLIVERYEGSETGWVDVTADINSHIPITGQKQDLSFMITGFSQVGKYRVHMALTNKNTDGSDNYQAIYRLVEEGSVLEATRVGNRNEIEGGRMDFKGTDAYGNEYGYIYIQVNNP